ncbi:MAG: chemotaxis protein CheA [Ruminococcaceae bacterium]|nr:chemotaxis protein CheA [Oscillospiraceae bacterium]
MSVIDDSMRPMLDTFIFETTTLLDQLDEILLEAEKEKALTDDQINEIFRTMHTVKGSAAMMGLNDISVMTHRAEDMFFIIRDDPSKMDDQNTGVIFDILFQVSDFLRQELGNIQENPDDYQPEDPTQLTGIIQHEIAVLKGEAAHEAAPAAAAAPAVAPAAAEAPAAATATGDHVHTFRVFFQDDAQMVHVRAFMLMNRLKEYGEVLDSVPPNPEVSPGALKEIEENGFMFRIEFEGDIGLISHVIEEDTDVASYEEVEAEAPAAADAPAAQMQQEADDSAEDTQVAEKPVEVQRKTAGGGPSPGKQSLISVNQSKLDNLVNIMGEIVIAESMVASNPDLKDLPLDNFNKSARQLRKLTDQLQDIVMSIRMVPLTGTFQKMGRIVRDMNKNLGKDTELVTLGGEVEVDKNITDVLADPLMHMIRNSMDHGIEMPEDRRAAGKREPARVVLQAQNVGSDIVITIEDNGKGLNREVLLNKAERNGILTKPRSDYSDKEAFMLIMTAGFSTNEVVTEYSGRGVGMDVVRKNIEKVGGTVSVDSVPGEGTTFTIKIPLTLAIVDGMEVGVAEDTFTIPITSISQIYKLSEETELLYDTDGTEMVMVRGECYPIIRLHRIYDIDTEVTELSEGILIIVESGESKACIFTDRLIGEQQVVVKSFPKFFDRYNVKELGFSGCTIMGDGSISLILDINSLLGAYRTDSSSMVRSMY